MNTDQEIRTAAFNWLTENALLNDNVFLRKDMEKGFDFKGDRVPLVGPVGIFKPRIMGFPLSITSAPKGPYDDKFTEDGLLSYRYRGTNPQHHDNAGLREVMRRNLPLIYFLGFVSGKYIAAWPVFIIEDDPITLRFKVAVDNKNLLSQEPNEMNDGNEDLRKYITATIRLRYEQKDFREKVIHAYRSQCAFCRLKHTELLDAAHILPYNEPKCRSTVDNGLSLCKIHHAAFDKFILGVTSDYIIKVRSDILEEFDGPMLQHGLKGLHNQPIILPHQIEWQPNRQFLDIRFERFRRVG